MLKVPQVIAGVNYREAKNGYDLCWGRSLSGDELAKRVNEVASEQKFDKDTVLVLALIPSDEFQMYLRFRNFLHDNGYNQALSEVTTSK